LGYFSLAIKPLTVKGETVSNTTRKKLMRISEVFLHGERFFTDKMVLGKIYGFIGNKFRCGRQGSHEVEKTIGIDEPEYHFMQDILGYFVHGM
jgi:hypothetical protein